MTLERLRRLGEEADASALLAFYDGLGAETIRLFRPLGETTTLQRCREVVKGNLTDPPARYDLVAFTEREMVGWSFIQDLCGRQPAFGLCIADGYQGKGLGGRLFDRVLAWARQVGLGTIYLCVVHDNLRAMRLYESRGFSGDAETLGEDGLVYREMSLTC